VLHKALSSPVRTRAGSHVKRVPEEPSLFKTIYLTARNDSAQPVLETINKGGHATNTCLRGASTFPKRRLPVWKPCAWRLEERSSESKHPLIPLIMTRHVASRLVRLTL